MRTRLIISAILIAVVVAFGLMWVRSARHGDGVAFFMPGGSTQAVGSFDGSAFLFVSTISAGPDKGLSARREDVDPSLYGEFSTVFGDAASVAFHLDRFGLLAGRADALAMGLNGNWCVLQLPYWFLIAMASTTTAIVGFPAWRFRRRTAHGLCPTCGYDLRASPARCPECGTISPRAGDLDVR